MVQNVLVLGSTGNAGSCIVSGLLSSPGDFKVFAGVRSVSLEKPIVKTFKENGATIVAVSIESPKHELLKVLQGIDILVAGVTYAQILAQIGLADLAKEAGVKRFVPSDFATVGVEGSRMLFDAKLKVHKHIESIQLGYTYIDMGWWMQTNLPSRTPHPMAAFYPEIITNSTRYYFTGASRRSIYTDVRDLLTFIGPILNDLRTLNKYVILWGEEITQKQIFGLYREITGEDIKLITKTKEDVERLIELAPHEICTERNMWEYLHDMWLRGNNTIEEAKKQGALDAKELYPSLPVRSFEAYAKETF